MSQSLSLLIMSHSPPTHHDTSNHVSPNRINQSEVSSTEMQRIQIQTKPSQLLITQINQGTNHLVSHTFAQMASQQAIKVHNRHE
jgi:hypothetical protein